MSDSLDDATRVSLASTTSSSRRLAKLAEKQANRERGIQELCNNVWTVVQQQYSVSGKCGEQQQYTVSHQYTQQVAVVDAAKFDSLRSQMNSHLKFATSEIASALFEHALAEQRLLALAHTRLLAPSGAPPPPAAFLRLLRHLVDAFGSGGGAAAATTAAASEAGVGLDARTLPTLRKLALALGAHCLAPGRVASAGSVRRDVAAADALSTAPEPAAASGALLSAVYHGEGCGWAAPLVQPLLSDLVDGRWLWTLLVNQPANWSAAPAAGLPRDADVRPFTSFTADRPAPASYRSGPLCPCLLHS